MIIDCFLFNNEIDMLLARLEYLYDYVDAFIIVEADKTFSAIPKEYIFEKNIALFQKYLPKIDYTKLFVNVNEEAIKNTPNKVYESVYWEIEAFQRNTIGEILKKYSQDAIVLIGDIDEIPDRNLFPFVFLQLKEHEILTFGMHMFYYNFKTMHSEKWPGTILTTNNLVAINSVENLRRNSRQLVFPIMHNAGWHFSYFGSIKSIQDKIKSFSHQEFNQEQFINLDKIKERVKENKDIFDRAEVKTVSPVSIPIEVIKCFESLQVQI